VKAVLADKFTNVEFITGSSHDALPILLARLAAEGTSPDFIFVDGDHTAAGVNKDLEFILNFQPTAQMVVLMHDTFNPGCRQGIFAASGAGIRTATTSIWISARACCTPTSPACARCGVAWGLPFSVPNRGRTSSRSSGRTS